MAKPPPKRGLGGKAPSLGSVCAFFSCIRRAEGSYRASGHQGSYLAWEICDTLRKCASGSLSELKAFSSETQRGREESAWLGSGYFYAQMLTSYVVIFANILALITWNFYINMYDE